MRVLGFLVVAFFMIVGAVALAAPQRLFALAPLALTPAGIYVAAGIRLTIGVILLSVAARSRFPSALRVLGLLAIIGGFVTLALGVDRSRMIVDWVSMKGLMPVRVFGVFVLIIGGFLAYAIGPPRES